MPGYTYSDYKQWEGNWELIKGIPYAMVPSPVITHQAIASRIILSLASNAEDCENCMVLGEQDWKIDESTTLRPDVVLVCDEPGDAFITKRPEIIFEIISKNSIEKDEKIKFRIYEEEKVPYYIIVYPSDLKARAFHLKSDKYTKVADFTHEILNFDDLLCDQASIDFNWVFKRLLKKKRS